MNSPQPRAPRGASGVHYEFRTPGASYRWPTRWKRTGRPSTLTFTRPSSRCPCPRSPVLGSAQSRHVTGLTNRSGFVRGTGAGSGSCCGPTSTSSTRRSIRTRSHGRWKARSTPSAIGGERRRPRSTRHYETSPTVRPWGTDRSRYLVRRGGNRDGRRGRGAHLEDEARPEARAARPSPKRLGNDPIDASFARATGPGAPSYDGRPGPLKDEISAGRRGSRS